MPAIEILDEFLALVSLDNPSLGERQVADRILSRLRDMGYDPIEDETGKGHGGNAGNLLCIIPGDPTKHTLLFACHMDSVPPCRNKRIRVENGMVHTDGTTVLGSDNLAGAAVLLSLAAGIREGSVNCGTVILVFTVAEEIGLLGSKNLVLPEIRPDFSYVVDGGGAVGSASVSSPSHNALDITVIGRASHAGMEPEKGINAIQVAAQAIHSLRLGRIDEETTCSIGIIEGGVARNIVCGQVTIKAECRSRSEKKLQMVTDDIICAFRKACGQFGAGCDIDVKHEYSSYRIQPEEEILRRFMRACSTLGIPAVLEESGGGSDTNIFHEKGIYGLNIGAGMEQVHTLEERIKVSSLDQLARLVRALAEDNG